MNVELKPGIHWVGAVDWSIRDFHGYRTDSGSTYNAYLVVDEAPALIDSVKAPFASTLLRHIQEVLPLDEIRYIVCNHAEPDHSGSLSAAVAACPNAVVVCDAKCHRILGMHYDTEGWEFKIVKTGDEISLGKRTLQFIETPMVHWPESMFTYCPEEKLLFSMDAFGQHYASASRFDDEQSLDIIMQEAKTYFANIVMLYSKPIARTLAVASGLDIEMIAPSHGIVWRSSIAEIIEAYVEWVALKRQPKVLVVFDSMWSSTEKMALAIGEGAAEAGAVVKVHNVNATNRTTLATEVLDAACVAVGSPTLNMTLMPEMASVLTYWKGLRPAGKHAFAFGSHGWSGGGARDCEAYIKDLRWEQVRPMLDVKFVPTEENLADCRAAGRELGVRALELHASDFPAEKS